MTDDVIAHLVYTFLITPLIWHWFYLNKESEAVLYFEHSHS